MNTLKILIIVLTLYLFRVDGLVSSVHTTTLTPTEQLIQKYFPENYQTARAVFMAESGLREKIVSKTGDWGVTQINCYAHRFQVPSCEWLLNSENNISFARKLYVRSGWGIWSAFTNGSYRRYL